MNFEKSIFILCCLLLLLADPTRADIFNPLYDQIPSKLLEVTQLKKKDHQNRNIYVLKYDCMCGVKAVEIVKKLRQIRIYSMCVPFNEKENHEKYKIVSVSKNKNSFNFKVKRFNSNKTSILSFKKINDRIYHSNIKSERGGFDSDEEVVTKYVYFVSASIKNSFKEIAEECGNFDG